MAMMSQPIQPSAAKGKASLTHVPCKFFKQGQCTAGASCTFSHVTPESGQQKQPCQYFQKGSCKFGHKCALAHILPGQPMSMDRKNKRQAQALSVSQSQQVQSPTTIPINLPLALNASISMATSSTSPPAHTPLVSSITPPGIRSSGMSFSPTEDHHHPSMSASSAEVSKPLPPASFAAALARNLNLNHDGSGHSISAVGDSFTSSSHINGGGSSDPKLQPSLPTSSSAASSDWSTLVNNGNGNGVHLGDFGRRTSIGHPRLPNSVPIPSSSSSSNQRKPFSAPPINGEFSSPSLFPPSSSLTNGHHNGSLHSSNAPSPSPFSSSPFSPPGSKSLFLSVSYDVDNRGLQDDGGLSAGRAFSASVSGPGGMWPVPASSSYDRHESTAMRLRRDTEEHDDLVGRYQPRHHHHGDDEDQEEDHQEELLPSSLSELLTPTEMERRIRRGSNHTPGHPVGFMSLSSSGGGGAGSFGSSGLLLTRSENNSGVGGMVMNGVVNGDAEILRSSDRKDPFSAFQQSGEEEEVLSPSQASVSFLPDFGKRNLVPPFSSTLSNQQKTPTMASLSSFSNNGVSHHHNSSDFSSSYNNRLTHQPQQQQQYSQGWGSSTTKIYTQPIGFNGGSSFKGFEDDGDESYAALSPSSRALQSHVPGQSLPPGLAAGLSRLHLTPFTQTSVLSNTNSGSHYANAFSPPRSNDTSSPPFSETHPTPTTQFSPGVIGSGTTRKSVSEWTSWDPFSNEPSAATTAVSPTSARGSFLHQAPSLATATATTAANTTLQNSNTWHGVGEAATVNQSLKPQHLPQHRSFSGNSYNQQEEDEYQEDFLFE